MIETANSLKKPGFSACVTTILIVWCATFVVAENTGDPADGQADTPAPSLWVTPLVLDFGPVGLGETSSQLTATITNTGDATLTNFAGGGLDSPFSASQNCAGGVPPGSSCQYFFTFSPTSTGSQTAISQTSTNAGTIHIEVRGEGVGAELHVNPLALDFGSVYTAGSTAQQSVTIRNTGLSTLANFAGGGVNAPFSASQNCAAGVEPGATCQYFFGFSPTAPGTFTATSNSGTNAGPFSIELQGRGRSIIFGSGQRVTPQSLNFGPVGVDLSGGSLAVEVTNQSPISAITDFAGGGVNPPFSASQNCAGGVGPGESCQFFYSFHPTEPGIFTATSNVTNSVGSFAIELRGEGVGPQLSVSPLVLDFGPVTVGSTGTSQLVTVKNTGLSELSAFAGGGVNPPFIASQNCAGGIAPGESCQFTYNFSPTEEGLFHTTSSVSTNAGSFSIQLIGGVDIVVFADGFESGDTSQWSGGAP